MPAGDTNARTIPGEYQLIDAELLDLDLHNPRLPEEILGASESAVLKYLWDHGTLEELAQSLVDNGYFGHEPLIVIQNNSRFTVLEGNRRLGALKVLMGHAPAPELDLAFSLDPPPSDVQLDRLRRIPTFLVADHEEVHNFLGFRHIGGLKTWSAEAKARYLRTEVDRLVAANPSEGNVFRAVGRRVGSNAQGVRNPYVALSLLVHGRDEYGIDTSYVQSNRFGVWARCMNARDLRDYLGIGSLTTYQDCVTSINGVSGERLREVINDLTPSSLDTQAILSDSRDVTVYGQVLANERAHQVLRETGSLRVARQVVEQASLPARVELLIQTLRLILEEVQEYGSTSQLVVPAERLARLARSLSTAVKDTADDADQS